MARPERLGPYRIGEPLGKGGMGQVYAAIHEETADRVAVKVLSPELAVAEGFRERFEAEIESLKRLRHVGIVQLFGYGEDGGILFYSMELVEGASLDEELRNGRRFTWREVAQIAIQVCRALKHAHDHGVVHRDIKPGNILLGQQERVKLADFGIAQLFGSTQLTAAGGIVGTADFMSPEQAGGQPVTHRCDQYSLGCVMYALLAGRPPFRAGTLPEMLQLQRYADPEPVRRYAPQTPKHLEEAIAQLLAKSPSERFPNTLVLARHLEAMTLALSRPGRDDFHLEGGVSTPIEMAITQVESPPEEEESIDLMIAPSTADGPAGHGDLPTLAPEQEDETQEEALKEDPQRQTFTVVQDDGSPDAVPMRLQVILQVALLAGLFGLCSYGIYAALRPATADELVAAIEDFNDEDWLAGRERARSKLQAFLARYPEDPRVASFEAQRKMLAASKLESRLRLALLQGDSLDPPLSPEEQLYVEALRASRVSPTSGGQRFAEFLNLLSESPPTDPAANVVRENLVTLAKEQLERLEPLIADEAAGHLALIQERLQTARELQGTSPEKAATICRALLAFYADKPWAEEAVGQTERVLEECSGSTSREDTKDE